MATNELDELRDEVSSFVDSGPENQYINWIQDTICVQLDIVEGDLLAVIEVVKVDDRYDELKTGDNVTDAPDDLGEIGQVFVSTIEYETGSSVELTLERPEKHEPKQYRERISL